MQTSSVTSPFNQHGDLTRSLAAGPAELSCRAVAGDGELDLHLRIRHEVFVREQGMFAATDRDEHDADPATIHVLGVSAGVAAGTVRLYPLDDAGLWKGDRLAVLRAFRTHGVGRPLVQFAVRTAAERGGHTMRAHIQLANVRFFQRLGWHPEGDPVEYCGEPHQQMTIDLRAIPGS